METYRELRRGLEAIEKREAQTLLKTLLETRSPKRHMQTRGQCIKCGAWRVLGKRGDFKGYCKRCKRKYKAKGV